MLSRPSNIPPLHHVCLKCTGLVVISYYKVDQNATGERNNVLPPLGDAYIMSLSKCLSGSPSISIITIIIAIGVLLGIPQRRAECKELAGSGRSSLGRKRSQSFAFVEGKWKFQIDTWLCMIRTIYQTSNVHRPSFNSFPDTLSLRIVRWNRPGIR